LTRRCRGVAIAGMSGSLYLEPREIAALRAEMGEFRPVDRVKGTNYFRRGAVGELEPMALDDSAEGAFGVEAQVQGSRAYEVSWIFDPGTHWESACSCSVGFRCKHTFAMAMRILAEAGAGPDAAGLPAWVPFGAESVSKPMGAGAGATGRPRVSAPTAELIALLEKHHGRELNKAEIGFVNKLDRLWQRHQRDGTIYSQELAEVSLADRGAGLYYDPNPAIRGWWDTPLASPLELWQFLACFAERANRPLPALMKPVTDTAAARAKVEALERRRRVEHWHQIFCAPVSPESDEAAATIPEVRLRLGEPKLIWEYRSGPDAPWRTAKGGMVKQWFETASAQPAGVPAARLALLQEVQLRRLQNRQGYGYYGGGTEPQTLKLEDEATSGIIHWLVSHPELRHLFVNNDGVPYEMAPEALTWVARPAPEDPHDVELFMATADGTPLPHGMVVLAGPPPLGLYEHFIYTLPPLLPGILAGKTARVPREALELPEAVRHLGRARVRSQQGLVLPELEWVVLVPYFVCQVSEQLGVRDRLRVELRAQSSTGTHACERQGSTWVMPAEHAAAGPKDPGGKVVDLDFSRAEAAVRFLGDLTLQWTGWAHGWERPMTKNFPDEFAAWAAAVRAAGVEIRCDPLLAGLTRPADRAHVEMEATPVGAEQGGGIDWFDLKLAVRAEDATLTPAEIALLLKARGRFVLLKDKGWRRLELALAEGQADKLNELGLDASSLGEGGQRQRFHALQLADERIAGLLPEQHAARARERAASLRALAPPAVPATLSAELRPYQQEGFHFLAHLAANGLGGVLADDMGLGKTVQALTWLLWLAQERAGASPARGSGARAAPAGLRVLVVCPKSVATNWEMETRRFAPSLSVASFRARDTAVPEADLVVINYAQLRLAGDVLKAVVWDVVILDEGQNIKNPQSQTAQVARDLRATHRLVLTGTPIENRVLDLWSLFAFAMPGLLGGQTAFKRAFNDKTDPLARARLGRRVRHFMLRRTKAQVAADLPARIEEDLVVELEPGQRKLYETELKRARLMLLQAKSAREFDGLRFNILQSLLRLRQICCDPRLLGAGGEGGDSAKIAALFDQIEPILAEGHKVLIFSQFVSLLEILQAELAQREIKHLTITGQTENRQAIVDEFQTSPDIRVFLLSLKAAGSGLNLTAASYVVLYDPWWNPAVEAQAIDRTHRIGQVNQVIAYRLLAKDTVEEKIRLLQKSKAELARAVVQEESLASVMNLDDLRYVLG